MGLIYKIGLKLTKQKGSNRKIGYSLLLKSNYLLFIVLNC